MMAGAEIVSLSAASRECHRLEFSRGSLVSCY